MEKLLESYELRLKLVFEELEKETCKDQKKVLKDRIIYYRHFISDVKELIESRKLFEQSIAKREAEKKEAKQSLIPCNKFMWGDCSCESECRRGQLKQ